MSMHYAKRIAEIVTLINNAEDILLNAKPAKKSFQQVVDILQEAAKQAAVGVQNLSDSGDSLSAEAASQYALAFRSAQEVIAAWLPKLRRTGVNCEVLARLLPPDLQPPPSLHTA